MASLRVCHVPLLRVPGLARATADTVDLHLHRCTDGGEQSQSSNERQRSSGRSDPTRLPNKPSGWAL
eukprot:6323797-Prymnesium_polylepis.1